MTRNPASRGWGGRGGEREERANASDEREDHGNLQKTLVLPWFRDHDRPNHMFSYGFRAGLLPTGLWVSGSREPLFTLRERLHTEREAPETIGKHMVWAIVVAKP